MKIIEGVHSCAAKQGIAEAEALKQGMQAKSKEFTEERSDSLLPAGVLHRLYPFHPT